MTFKQLGREKMYTGRAFDVMRVELSLPDGIVRPYDLVDHADSVTVLPVDDNNCILFVSQYRVGCDCNLLELPAGVLEEGEDPADGASREMREETGMGATELRRLGDFYLAPGYSSEYMVVFLATGLYPQPLDKDADEFLQLQSIPVADALELAARGEIRDAKTLATLLLASRHLTK